MSTPTALVILDGFGVTTPSTHNAITSAHTPTLHYLFTHYPHTTLHASGCAVGLPEGYIGNSEVGHQTIGSGRVTKEPLVLINEAIKANTFASNIILKKFLTDLALTHKPLHLIGLVSDAGVHSSLEHLYALITEAHNYSIKKVYIHAILDGRDVAPQSALKYLEQLTQFCKDKGIGTIASIIGRWFAMDRNGNWERTKQAYDLLTIPQSITLQSLPEILAAYYTQNITDEYIPPIQLIEHATIQNGDGVIFFNIRADRMRQLTECFLNSRFKHFSRMQLNTVSILTLTPYFSTQYLDRALFNQALLTNTLKDVLQENNKSMFTIAETEKYAHVTYFFDGRREERYPMESRVLIPSLPVKNYEKHPCMSAAEITNAVVTSLNTNAKDFYLINYANADMVGHTGNFDATVSAVECLDEELKKLYKSIVEERNGTLYITGDHGKAEDMFDVRTNQPRTAHTTHPVPFIMIQHILKGQSHELPLHELSDIAPYILKYMNLPIPQIMQKKEAF